MPVENLGNISVDNHGFKKVSLKTGSGVWFQILAGVTNLPVLTLKASLKE